MSWPGFDFFGSKSRRSISHWVEIGEKTHQLAKFERCDSLRCDQIESECKLMKRLANKKCEENQRFDEFCPKWVEDRRRKGKRPKSPDLFGSLDDSPIENRCPVLHDKMNLIQGDSKKSQTVVCPEYVPQTPERKVRKSPFPRKKIRKSFCASSKLDNESLCEKPVFTDGWDQVSNSEKDNQQIRSQVFTSQQSVSAGLSCLEKYHLEEEFGVQRVCANSGKSNSWNILSDSDCCSYVSRASPTLSEIQNRSVSPESTVLSVSSSSSLSPIKSQATGSSGSTLESSSLETVVICDYWEKQQRRNRSLRLGKLAKALKQRIQHIKSDLAMRRYDENNRDSIDVDIQSSISQWGIFYSRVKEISSENILNIVDSQPLRRFTDNDESDIDETDEKFANSASIYKPLTIIENNFLGRVLIAPRYIKFQENYRNINRRYGSK